MHLYHDKRKGKQEIGDTVGISATVNSNKILLIEIQGVSHTWPKHSRSLNLKCTENVRSQFVVQFDYQMVFSHIKKSCLGMNIPLASF